MSLTQEGKLKPYEAAEALVSVVRQGVDVDSVSMPRGNEIEDTISLADLIVEAGVSSRETVERAIPAAATTWGEQGAALLHANVLSEQAVVTALRLKALVGLGYLPRERAIQLLNHCVREKAPLEIAFANLGVNVPTRMQWTWVKALRPS
jgi:hypothetical protein